MFRVAMVVLAGTVAADPVRREMPSGDEVTELRLFLAVVSVILGVGLFSSRARISDLSEQLTTAKAAADSRALELSDQVEVLEATQTDREDRFRLMAGACARLINDREVDDERIRYAANATAVGEMSVADLGSYLEGEIRADAFKRSPSLTTGRGAECR